MVPSIMLSLSKSYDVNFLSDTLTSFCHIFSRQSFKRKSFFFNLNIFLFPRWPPVNFCRTSNTCHKIFQSRLISCQNSHLYRRLPFIMRNFFNVILIPTVCCQLGFGNNNHPSLLSFPALAKPQDAGLSSGPDPLDLRGHLLRPGQFGGDQYP